MSEKIQIEAETDSAVKIDDLKKIYRVYNGPAARIMEIVTRRPRHTEVPALAGITFSVQRGQVVGVVGRNGSGKSTLLRILAGIIEPSGGAFKLTGRVASILDLGAGFIDGFSGIDNVYLNGRLMGMREKEVDDKLDGILAFAGLGKYSELAIRTYSSGMLLRLGFAIAQSIDADVLLVDEILMVGDVSFQRKCLKRMNEFRERGATILLVTHSLADLGAFCDRVIQIDEGRIKRDGPTEQVLKDYIDEMRGGDSYVGASLFEHLQPHRERSGDVIIQKVELIGGDGAKVAKLKTGDPLTVRIFYRAARSTRNPLFRLQLRNADGIMVHGTNTYRQGLDLGKLTGEGYLDVCYDSISLLEGRYYVTVGIYPDEYGQALADRAHDVHHLAYTLEVTSERSQGAGIVSMPHRWERAK